MGKRKSRAKPAPTKRMDKLDTIFSCPFCNHGSSVECIIDMKHLIGKAACRICEESFSTTITALTEAIDIYSEWIDECSHTKAKTWIVARRRFCFSHWSLPCPFSKSPLLNLFQQS